MNPPKALADQLYLDWGKALIEKNQLAEAETLVTLVGLGDKRDPVAPGEPVRITLRDPWLQTSQNRTSVTVVVTTQSGDREEATLNLSSDAKGLFVGRIPTTLGSPKPGDRVVQVRRQHPGHHQPARRGVGRGPGHHPVAQRDAQRTDPRGRSGAIHRPGPRQARTW